MTKTPKSPEHSTSSEIDPTGIISVNRKVSQLAKRNRVNSKLYCRINVFQGNYKNQKPILEKRRRDRINSSLDELKSLLLAIKQRDVSSVSFIFYRRLSFLITIFCVNK